MVLLGSTTGRNAADTMSGLWANLFAGSGSKSQEGQNDPSRQPAYSYTRLVQLHTKFSQFSERDLVEDSGGKVVETVKQLTEALLWGEKNDSNFFSFFCEKSILAEFVRVLDFPHAPKSIKLQLLQTLSMLVQNIRCQASVQHLFDNGCLNDLICMRLDFSDEEILAYYITLLKSLVMRLDSETVQFFFRPSASGSSGSSFPLYFEAAKFISHNDQMVHATVRTITLQVYKVTLSDQAMRTFVLHHAKESYFAQLAHHLRCLWLKFDESATACRASPPSSLASDPAMRAQTDFEIQQDFLIYLSDIFDLKVPGLTEILADRLLRLVMVPLLLSGGLFSSNADNRPMIMSLEVALFLCRHVFETFHCHELLQPMASIVLQENIPAAVARLLPKEMQSSMKVVNLLHKNKCRELFIRHLESQDEEVYVLAASVLHSCVQNQQFTTTFLAAAGVLPQEPPEQHKEAGRGILQLLFNPLSTCQTVGSQCQCEGALEARSSEQADLVVMLIHAIEQHTTLQPETVNFVCSMLWDMLSHPAMHKNDECRVALMDVLRMSYQNSARHVVALLEASDKDAWILDVFTNEWQEQRKARTAVRRACDDLCCILRCVAQPQASTREDTLKNKCFRPGVCLFLSLRRLLRDLELFQSRESTNDASAKNQVDVHKFAAFDELSPLDVSDELADQYKVDDCLQLGDMERVMCSMKTSEGKSTRYLLMHDFWLVLAQPDLSAPGSVRVKLRWPLWQILSSVDASNSQILQVALQSTNDHCSDAIELEFDDTNRCYSVDLHCSRRRKQIRSDLRHKVMNFVDGSLRQNTISPVMMI